MMQPTALNDHKLYCCIEEFDVGMTDHGMTGHGITDHGVTGHMMTDHVTDHGMTDHGLTDHGTTDHGFTDHAMTGFCRLSSGQARASTLPSQLHTSPLHPCFPA